MTAFASESKPIENPDTAPEAGVDLFLLQDDWVRVLETRNLDEACSLLSRTPVDHVLPNGDSVLFLAVLYRWKDLATLLLDAGWDPTHYDPDKSALCMACRSRQTGLVQKFLDACGDSSSWEKTDKPWRKRVGEALGVAIETDDLDMVRLFIPLATWKLDGMLYPARSARMVRFLCNLPDTIAFPPNTELLGLAIRTGREREVLAALIEAGVPFSMESRPGKFTHALCSAIDDDALFGWLVEKNPGTDPIEAYAPVFTALLEQAFGSKPAPFYRTGMLEKTLSLIPDLSQFIDIHVSYQRTIPEPLAPVLLRQLLLSSNRWNDAAGVSQSPLTVVGPVLFSIPAFVEGLKTAEPDFWHWLMKNFTHFVTPKFIETASIAFSPLPDSEGNTPLHLFAKKGEFRAPTTLWYRDIAMALLNAGCNPQERNLEGKTALEIAWENQGNPKMMLAMLMMTPNPEPCLLYDILSHLVKNIRHKDDVDLLVSLTENLEFLPTGQEKSLLHHSMEHIYGEPLVREIGIFLDRGMDINEKTQDRLDSTPLGLAIASVICTPYKGQITEKRVQNIDLLLSRGADPLLKNSAGESPWSMVEKNQDLQKHPLTRPMVEKMTAVVEARALEAIVFPAKTKNPENRGRL
jgi:hypothetical protein